MYIDTFWLALVAIWIIYLLWRVWKLRQIFQQTINTFSQYEERKRRLDRALCDILIYYDAFFLQKVQSKTRKEILKEQANTLRATFMDNVFEKAIIGNKIIPMDSPIGLLSNALDAQIIDSDDYSEINSDIVEKLEQRIKNTEI